MPWLSKVKGQNRLEKLGIKAGSIALESELGTFPLNIGKDYKLLIGREGVLSFVHLMKRGYLEAIILCIIPRY